jgi:hypothetical protein
MKRILLTILFPAAFLVISSSIAQKTDPEEERLLALIKEVQAQQAQIVANQGNIEGKLAEVGENIRVARIFSARSQ